MRVAIVHDWLTGMRGGERVLEALLDIYPDAELFTLLHVPGSVSEQIESRPIHASFVDRLPGVRRRYRFYLPLFPKAMASMDLTRFDLVISSSHCVAKGAQPRKGVPHVCYCHTPMRYVWDQYDAYFGPGRAPFAVRAAMRVLAPRLRAWDVRTAAHVTRFVANSNHVRRRIRDYYGRDASVLHPPVDIAAFAPRPTRGEHYVILGAPVPYKRVDLAVEAFGRLDRPLWVVGNSVGAGPPDLASAAPPNVRFLGRRSQSEVAEILGTARALLLPGVEDFGIAVVEALASGTPVIAYGVGGVRDTVSGLTDPGRVGPATGVFFHESTPESLAEAVGLCESHHWDPAVLTRSALPFHRDRFLEGMRREVNAAVDEARRGSASP